MTRDDIIRMAQEAGIGVKKDLEDWHVPVWHLGIDCLVRFADLVAKRAVSNIDPASSMSYQEGYAAGVAAEREACAKVCDDKWIYTASPSEMAEYIRARSKE